MQEISNREQPENLETDQGLILNDVDVKGSGELDDGSLLGKFKDAKSLADAYASLQSEFTRKSQKLSEYEKSDNFKTQTVLPKTLVENNDEMELSDQQVVESSKNDVLEPQNSDFAWQEQVDGFLLKNPTAKQFANEIVEEIYKDDSLKNSKQSLEVAFSRVLANKYKSESELVENQDFLEKYIFGNKKIVQKIVVNYLDSLKSANAPPVLVSSKGAHLGTGVFDKPQNLDEAKIIVQRMIKKQ